MSRSISTGSSGLSTIAKDQSMDMNGPLVPEKVLKSIQVCDIFKILKPLSPRSFIDIQG